jgi:hypothetical protein
MQSVPFTTKVVIFRIQLMAKWVMLFNATFNNISVISWWSDLLVEETGLCRENPKPASSH